MGRTIRIATSALVLTVATGLVGCTPIMSHGPRVVEGTQVGVTAAVIGGLEDEIGTALVPYLNEGKRRDDGSAEHFGVQLVIPTEGWDDDEPGESLLFGLQWDYFRERPSADSTRASGWGVHGTPTQLMPYIQAGIYSGDNAVFTTQGIGVVGPYLGLPPYAIFWSPGVGAEHRSGIVTVRAQMSTMIAASLDGDGFEGLGALPITLGVSIGLSERNQAVPGR